MNIADIIGNHETKMQLVVATTAAKKKNSSVPHALFEGPAGTGKTTFACALAELAGTVFIEEDPSSMKNIEAVRDVLKRIPSDGYDLGGNVIDEIKPAVLFFDEIHNLPLKGQELLGLVMENWRLAIPVHGSSQIAWVPRFTLIGATTLAGKLSKPFRDRFKMTFTFQTYDQDDSIKIIGKHAEKMGVEIDHAAALAISARGRGVPRILVRFLDRATDFSLALNKTKIDSDIVGAMFHVLHIDGLGLTTADTTILEALYEADGEPIGLDTLQVITNKAAATISNEIEPYLIQNGFLTRGPKGRALTEKGREYVSSNQPEQSGLKII